MKHISFPKIGQFRAVVTDIKHKARFAGVDENNDPIYNNDELPTLTFTGTVKLHGTNASVCFDGKNMWCQSRNEVIESGHFGFVDFVNKNKEDFYALFHQITGENILLESETIAIYGEWAGPGIQKGVGVSQLPEKHFFIFGCKIATEDDEESNYWVDHSQLRSTNPRISNVFEYPNYSIEIDFNKPKLVINDLIDITNEIEKQCPVAKQLGYEGIGEGVVWSTRYKGGVLRMKVKGEKHSATKVKKLVSVDPEKLKNIEAAITYLVTEQRYKQALQETGVPLDRKGTGALMKWLANDIMSEETDTLESNGLTWKDIAGRVTDGYRRMFFNDIDNNL